MWNFLQIVEDYKDYMVQIVKLLGYNCANVTEEVQEIIDFEDMLAKVWRIKLLC